MGAKENWVLRLVVAACQASPTVAARLNSDD